MKFSELRIDQRILKALHEMGFEDMTDIQARTLPLGLEGKDVIGQAMTGSGKTAAFGIPLIQKIVKHKGIQALVVTPTRELADQVGTEMKKFSKHIGLNVSIVYGGVGYEQQINQIRHAEIVVGTPGRLLDHMQQGILSLKKVKILVLDEADRMLDMGFIDDIHKIISQTPKERQTMLFSATMPDEIVRLAHRYLKNPAKIKTQSQISKHLLKHYYYDVKQEEKLSLLLHLINHEKPSLALIFTGTRRAADFVNRYLQSNGVESKALHGGHSQAARTDILAGFHRGQPHILVATDLAARGLDIKNITHIFNFDIPKNAEDYTHRIGRTARFGKTGKAISLLSKNDHQAFQQIVRYIDIEKIYHNFKLVPFRFSMHREERRERRFGRRPGWHRR
jgi:ATP-dependent RNA helicase DeaD